MAASVQFQMNAGYEYDASDRGRPFKAPRPFDQNPKMGVVSVRAGNSMHLFGDDDMDTGRFEVAAVFVANTVVGDERMNEADWTEGGECCPADLR